MSHLLVHFCEKGAYDPNMSAAADFAGEHVFHVTASENRDSIQAHGLDWRIMGANSGIAGSEVAEEEGIFLCRNLSEAFSFANFGVIAAVDVWQLPASEVTLEEHNDGWLITRRPVAPEHLTLVRTVTPAEAERLLEEVKAQFDSNG